MMEQMMKMQETVEKWRTELLPMTPEMFMCIVCMMFDEYHNAHRDSNPAEMAQTVATLVAQVNEQLGAYELG